MDMTKPTSLTLSRLSSNFVPSALRPLADRQGSGRTHRIGGLILRDDRAEHVIRPEFRRADLLKAGGVPVGAPIFFFDRRDVSRFRVDIERGRIAIQDGNDLTRVSRRPTGAAVAATTGVIDDLAKGHHAILVGIGAVRLLALACGAQQSGRMAADFALSRGGCFALAVKLDECALEHRVLLGRNAVVTLERRLLFASDVGAAGGEVGIYRVAKILHAGAPVGKIDRAFQVAPAAMAHWHSTERLAAFTNCIEAPSAPHIGRLGGVHGEITGILHRAVRIFLQIEFAGAGQHDGCDLPVTGTNIGGKPGRDVAVGGSGRLRRAKRE